MSRRTLHRRVAWPIALLVVAPPAYAQDLVINGGFAGGLTGWTLSGEGAATPSADDIDDDPGSGSVLLRNEVTTAGSRTHPIDQCITIELPGEYRFGASGRVDPSQAPGRAVVGFTAYSGPACDGAIVGGGGNFIPRSTGWASFELVFLIPDVPRTFWLRVAVDKPGAEGTLEVQVDDVYLIRTERLFRSGFE